METDHIQDHIQDTDVISFTAVIHIAPLFYILLKMPQILCN